MKKNYPSLTLMICTILAFCFSCKKDSTPTTITPLTPAPISATGTVVEYQITNMNNYFTMITYNDSLGNPFEITDPALFTNGSESFSITTKPFNAKLETTINNITSSSIYFTLLIKVDGEIKNFIQCSSPAMNISTHTVEFIVE